MEYEDPAGLVRAPEILELRADSPFFERAQEIRDEIAQRAYELRGMAANGIEDHTLQKAL
jgi:hypothetical protein